MIVHKLNRLIFEFEYANPTAEPEKIDFEDLIKKLSKMTVEERETFLDGDTLDEAMKLEIKEITDGGLI